MSNYQISLLSLLLLVLIIPFVIGFFAAQDAVEVEVEVEEKCIRVEDTELWVWRCDFDNGDYCYYYSGSLQCNFAQGVE